MDVAILLFDDLTALDAIGPFEVLSRVPDARVRFVGKRKGQVRTSNRMLGLCVDADFSDVTAADAVVVPGGKGTKTLESDREVLDWVTTMHGCTRFTMSVCTGAMVLGAAGLLDGLAATTHWAYVERLAEFGAQHVKDRVVRSGKIWTSAGVSAGIDMGLALCVELGGPTLAREIQLALEYAPRPPFDAGTPDKAKSDVVERVRSKLRA